MPDPAKHPSAVDGNHGRCAFSFKRTINTLMVNHTNKSRGGLEPKRAIKAPIPRPPDGNWLWPGPMFSPSRSEVIRTLSTYAPGDFCWVFFPPPQKAVI